MYEKICERMKTQTSCGLNVSGSNVTLCVEQGMEHKQEGKLYGGAFSLNGVSETAIYAMSSQGVLVLFSSHFLRFLLHPSDSQTRLLDLLENVSWSRRRTTDGHMNIDLTPISQHTSHPAVLFRVIGTHDVTV